jgi:uncharacterized protein (TIGR02246 family)
VARLALALAVGSSLLIAVPLGAQELPITNAQTNTTASHRAFMEESYKNILGVLDALRARWKAKDAAGVAGLFADAGVLVPSRGGLRQGREAITDALSALLPGASELRISVTDFDPADRLLYVSGHYTFDEMPSSGPVYEDDGTYVMVLKREDDQWRIRSIVFRPDRISPS